MDVHSVGSIEVQWQLRLTMQIKYCFPFSSTFFHYHHLLTWFELYEWGTFQHIQNLCSHHTEFSHMVIILHGWIPWEQRVVCYLRFQRDNSLFKITVVETDVKWLMVPNSFIPLNMPTNAPTLTFANVTPCRSWHQMLSKCWAFQILKWYFGVDGSCEKEENQRC